MSFRQTINEKTKKTIIIEKEFIMRFIVEITETLTKQVEVEAENAEMARSKVKEMWDDEEIVLTGDDFWEVQFEVLKCEF